MVCSRKSGPLFELVPAWTQRLNASPNAWLARPLEMAVSGAVCFDKDIDQQAWAEHIESILCINIRLIVVYNYIDKSS